MSSKKSGDIDLSQLVPALKKGLRASLRYSGILFFIFVACVYGFILMRITTLSSVQPTDSDISSTSPAKLTAIPSVNAKVVQQLQELQNNSTNVKALFDNSRQNPFNE